MEQDPQEKHENKKLVAAGIVAAVLVVLGIIVVIILGIVNGSGTQPTDKQDNPTTNLFYDVLGNAAKQPQLRVAMYRATYANKADAETKQNIGTEASSVAEVDLATSKSRSVFATNASDAPRFTTGRCLDGVSYADDYTIKKIPRPTTLQAAADDLKSNQHLYKSSVPVFDPCPRLGFMQDVSADLASFRYSDGVFPVTLTDARAATWKNKVKEADLFTVKDEGMVSYNGKQLRKLGFTPKDDNNANSRLYALYAEAAGIDDLKQNPNAIYEYEFITINPGNTGGVGGYYLIDEAKKLPVYSELYGTNKDKESGKPASRFNIAKTKQTYAFGQPLALTFESPLELLP